MTYVNGISCCPPTVRQSNAPRQPRWSGSPSSRSHGSSRYNLITSSYSRVTHRRSSGLPGALDEITCLAEREYVGLHARCEKGDLERAHGDRSRLANQLVEPLLGYGSVALLVGVDSGRSAGGWAMDEDPERHRRARPPRPKA